MQDTTPYNFLTCDNIASVPFPDEFKNAIKEIKWEDFLWKTRGLPVHNAKYSLLDGRKLYFEEGPDGTPSLKEQDFTGEILMSGFFLGAPEDTFNFILIFKILFFQGEVKNITLSRTEKLSKEEYNKAVTNYSKEISKLLNRRNKLWYKLFYIPFRFIVTWTAVILIGILEFIQKLIESVALFLTKF